MSGEKFFPRCLSASLRRGLNTVILQNIGDGFKRQQVAEIEQRSLNSAIAPASILPGHSNHQRGNLGSRSRSPCATVRASIILLGDQPFDAKPTASRESRSLRPRLAASVRFSLLSPP